MSSTAVFKTLTRSLNAPRTAGRLNVTCTASRHATPLRNANIGASRSFSSGSTFHTHPSPRNRWLFASVTSLLFLSTSLLSTPLLADEDQSESKKPAFTKEQVRLICIIGGPSSGKSTQLHNIVKRFDIKEMKASGDLQKQLSEAVSNASNGNKPRVIIEGFPSTIEQADKFQAEVCPILVIISIVLDSKKGVARITEKIDQNDAKINWKRFEDKSEGIIKKFRFQGNILEITGEWPADEVWEQVEAKLESALELDDRGEL